MLQLGQVRDTIFSPNMVSMDQWHSPQTIGIGFYHITSGMISNNQHDKWSKSAT